MSDPLPRELVSPGRFTDKIAVVFGGGQTPGEGIGNGRATARLLAAEGAVVVAVDRDRDRAEATAAEIRAEGGRAEAIAADITVTDDIHRAFSTVLERFGRVDVLHNNVGVSLAAGDSPLEEIDAETFERVTRINLTGMVMSCRRGLEIMREQRSGVIVNISSTAAVLRYPNIAYKTSKAGVIALTESIAIENAHYGVRANCLLPGLMATPMAIEPRVGRGGRSREDVVRERDSHVPLGRMGSGWDTAAAAVFLASEHARFITGVALRVDGGQCLLVG